MSKKIQNPTNKDCLIGYSGLIGKELQAQRKFAYRFNSKNINKIKNMIFDKVICCAAPGTKWLANLEPEKDKKKIYLLINCLKTIKAQKFILISTVDIFGRKRDIDEESKPNSYRNNYYGRHRLLLENFAKKKFKENLLIARISGIVGKFLKKNILFDLKHSNNLTQINLKSRFQYYPIQNLWKDINIVLKKKLKVIHLNSEPILTSEIVNLKFTKFTECKNHKSKKVLYDMKSIYSKKIKNRNYYFYSKAYILKIIKKYFNEK
jgi:dTDP-4-dehydrorhamnose reductase